MTFEASEESQHVLSVQDPEGEDFKILGVTYDCSLSMQTECDMLATECAWKLRALLRSRRFHTTGDMIRLYKAQLLSFIEHRTAAVSCTFSLIQPKGARSASLALSRLALV